MTLNDGRDLCLECLDSATMDLQEFFEGLMMEIKQQIPLLLVERDALNEAMEKEKARKTTHFTHKRTRHYLLNY